METGFLYLTIVSGALSAVFLSVGFFRGIRRCNNAALRERHFCIRIDTHYFRVTRLYDQCNPFRKRVDGNGLLFHLSVLLPFLSVSCAFLIRYIRDYVRNTLSTSAGYGYYLIPAVVTLVSGKFSCRKLCGSGR